MTIKFRQNATISGHVYRIGEVYSFAAADEATQIGSGNAVSWPASSGGPAQVVVASGDPTGVTDTANLQAALNNGGAIYLSGTYFTNATLTANSSVYIRGSGASDGYSYTGTTGGNTANTSIVINTSTLDCLVFATTGCFIEGVHISNSSSTAATAGAGIKLSVAHGSSVISCSTYGFYVGIDCAATVAFALAFNKIYGPAGYGIRNANVTQPDEDDGTVIGNWIEATGLNSSTPGAGIFWQSGGGLKIASNKISREPRTVNSANYFNYGIWMQPTSGVSTGDHLITGNSIENLRSHGIYLDGSAGGSGSFDAIVIGDNQFQLLSTAYAVYISGVPGSYSFSDVTIDNLTTRAAGGFVNVFDGANNVRIGACIADTLGSNPIFIGQNRGAAQASVGVANVSYDISKISIKTRAATQPIFVDYTTNATDSHLQAPQLRTYTREIPNLGASVPITTNVGQLLLNKFGCARIKVTVAGNFAGVGGIYLQSERSLVCNSSNVVAATTIGTDVTNAAVTITFDVGTNNTCIVKITTVTGQGLSASQVGCGQITFEMAGLIQEFDVLN